MADTIVSIKIDGAEIRRLRKAHNMKLTDLADIMGYKKSMVNNIECGKDPMRHVIAFAYMARHFGVPMEQLTSVEIMEV